MIRVFVPGDGGWAGLGLTGDHVGLHLSQEILGMRFQVGEVLALLNDWRCIVGRADACQAFELIFADQQQVFQLVRAALLDS